MLCKDPDDIEVKFDSLPKQVQKAIKDRLTNIDTDETWICSHCEQPGEMSIDDVDAPCQDCAEGMADDLMDRAKEGDWT